MLTQPCRTKLAEVERADPSVITGLTMRKVLSAHTRTDVARISNVNARVRFIAKKSCRLRSCWSGWASQARWSCWPAYRAGRACWSCITLRPDGSGRSQWTGGTLRTRRSCWSNGAGWSSRSGSPGISGRSGGTGAEGSGWSSLASWSCWSRGTGAARAAWSARSSRSGGAMTGCSGRTQRSAVSLWPLGAFRSRFRYERVRGAQDA